MKRDERPTQMGISVEGVFSDSQKITIERIQNKFDAIAQFMNIYEFFQNSAGKWFSQRTTQDLNLGSSQAGSSDLRMEFLTPDDGNVIKLCEQHRIDPTQAVCGVSIRWDGKIGMNEAKQTGTNLIVPIPNSDNPQAGRLLYQNGTLLPTPATTHYSLDEDDNLRLVTQTNSFSIQERIWFAGPNFRLRTSLIQQADGCYLTSFCTEIRLGGAPAAAQSAASSQSA